MKKLYVELDLTLFDGGAAAGGEGGGAVASAGGGTNASEAGAEPQTGDAAAESAEALPEKTPEERRAEYEKLIGEYSDLYEADRKAGIEKAVRERFKGTEKKMQAYDKMLPLMETFAGRYGIDASNTDALIEAISNDNVLYEDEAMQRGMSVDQLKQWKRMEAENNMYRRAQEEQRRQAAAQQLYAQWEQEAAQVKQLYPDFDLQSEMNNPETGERFRQLMGARVGVKTAYEVIHQSEIINGIATRAVEDTTAKVRNDIAARGQRPAEAGASGSPAVKTQKLNPATLTNAQLEEISRRVLRGERITF